MENAKQLVELKSFLANGEPWKALELFETIVRDDCDCQIFESSRLLANYIRNSSIFKRRLLYLRLHKCNALSRLYLAFQFNTFSDFKFPKKFIFMGSSTKDPEWYREKSPAHRHYLTAVGSNRFFNLGLLSDGSPVSEPHLVNLPRLKTIEMSNSHTIFLTEANELYGCGKASSFLPDRPEEHDGGYVALPTRIQMPKKKGAEPRGDDDGVVERIWVKEGGTEYVVGGECFYVGKCIPHTPTTRKIASNCAIDTEAHFPIPSRFPNFQTARIEFDGKSVEIYIKMDDFSLIWDRNSAFEAPKHVQLIINGFAENPKFQEFQVLGDGTIYLAESGLMKGKLELWRNRDDGFQVNKKTILEHFDTKYTLVAVLEEVPGSQGTQFFRVSPDGQNLIMKKGEEKIPTPDTIKNLSEFQSIQLHEIVKNRENQYDPIDVPMDLTIIFQESNRNFENLNEENEEFVDMTTVEFQVNRLLFEWTLPSFSGRILENSEIYLDWNGREFEFQLDWERPLLPITFIPPNSAPSDIWHLISTEKQSIPCHRNLILLHSRQITAMQRFNTYGAFGMSSEDVEKPVEIEMNATAEVIRNSLRGMVDLRTLWGIKTIELIECINFYDYHLMEEMFHDAFEILTDTVTEHTLPYLYELFHSYEDHVVELLVKRPHLVYTSISGIQPPKRLLEKFASKLPQTVHHQRELRLPEHLWSLSTYEPEYVIRSLVNLDEDSEDVIWSALREECGEELATWHSEAMKRRRITVGRTRNSTGSNRRDSMNAKMTMTSSPIPIGGGTPRPNTESSFNSPGALQQSPLQQSMSPIQKALPIFKPRNSNSISNSLEDFPEMGFSPISPSSSTPSRRFAPKGARFKKDTEILKPLPPVNPWKTTSTSSGASAWIPEESVAFDEVVRKEETLQRKIKTGFKRVQLLPHVELEELARAQIREVFGQEFGEDALITVEVMDFETENEEQIVWGHMPGLVRR